MRTMLPGEEEEGEGESRRGKTAEAGAHAREETSEIFFYPKLRR